MLPGIGTTLSANPAQLGIVLGAFLVGVGIFQIPAGFASIRWGARRVSLAGLAGLGAADALCAIAPSWPVLAVLRFAAGVGAAFFFSPALALVASYFPAGRRGPVIGFFNGGFSVGGAFGLVGGAVLGASLGWQLTMLLGGLALLAATGGAALVLPRGPPEEMREPVRELVRRGRAVLFSRSIWALSVALTGFWAALFVTAQYFVKFGQDVHPEWAVGLSGAVVATLVFLSFPGGPIGGWLAERGFDRRWLAGLFAGASGGMVALLPFLDLAPLVVLMVLLGLADGIVFAILYLIPSYLPESRGADLALGVGVVNCIQVMLGGALTVLFGVLVTDWGYTLAWLAAGAWTIGLLPLLWLVRPTSASPGSPAAG